MTRVCVHELLLLRFCLYSTIFSCHLRRCTSCCCWFFIYLFLFLIIYLLAFVVETLIFFYNSLCTEQQHVETNLKATFAGISVFLCFQDGNKKYPCDKGDQINAASYIPYLGAECRDILLVVQVITVAGNSSHPLICVLIICAIETCWYFISH